MSDPNSTLEDSKYAPHRLYTKIPSRYQTIQLQARNPNTGGSVNKLDYEERQYTRTTVQQEILDKIAARNAKLALNNPAPVTPIPPITPTTPITPITPSINSDDTSSNMNSPLEEDVIAKFKARAEASEKGKGKENFKITPVMPTHLTSKTLNPNALEWSFPANTVSYTLEEGQAQYAKAKAISQGTEAIKPVKASIAESADIITPVKQKIAQNTVATTSVEATMTQDTKAVAPIEFAHVTVNDAKTAALGLNVKKDPGLPDEGSSIFVTSSEDAAERENATHFTSWGIPQARATPRTSKHLCLTFLIIIADIKTGAKVRKVVLRGLPVSADLTLVHSIIHGGAIDNFALGANGTAQVTFTTPEACDAYYAKYPNGVAVKYKGRSYVVFVEKTTDVNVVSGMLRGQLEAGASRCVRAVGADHDWGMGALIKLAEGKTRKGKLEHIADVWRNEVSRSHWWVNAKADTAPRSELSCSASHQLATLSPSRACSCVMRIGRRATSSSWMTRARKRQAFTWSKRLGVQQDDGRQG